MCKTGSVVPATYADLDKCSRDIFTKGYGFGSVKLFFKTKSESGLELQSQAQPAQRSPK
uniref:Uncharacterized protein n=1 Tax=Spermophilus dauricus TaxID=99837 RepID=A0A8C9Q0F4_SPEDA